MILHTGTEGSVTTILIKIIQSLGLILDLIPELPPDSWLSNKDLCSYHMIIFYRNNSGSLIPDSKIT